MTQGVLVSVSVLAVVYTQILVSDRIGECPYRPFSTFMGHQNLVIFVVNIQKQIKLVKMKVHQK